MPLKTTLAALLMFVLTAGCAGPVTSLPAPRAAAARPTVDAATAARIKASFARADEAAAKIKAILDYRPGKDSIGGDQ